MIFKNIYLCVLLFLSRMNVNGYMVEFLSMEARKSDCKKKKGGQILTVHFIF